MSNLERVPGGAPSGRQNQIKGNVGHSRKKLKRIGEEIFQEIGGKVGLKGIVAYKSKIAVLKLNPYSVIEGSSK
jgi:hypothetical protein